MKISQLLLTLLIVVINACNTKQQQKASDMETQRDSLVPLQVTVLAELPDSLQPKTVLQDKMPKPGVVTKTGGITKMLPVLQNEKGETILDAEGKPFIMGDGGKSNFTNLTTDNGLPLDAVYWSVQDKFGNLWFATGGGGVTRYDGKSFTTFTTDQGLAHNAVFIMTEDKKGNLWFGTGGGGVSRYDGKSFTTFNTDHGLASNVVQMITEDKTGNIWIGTEDGGVSRYDGKSFTTFTTAQGLASNNVIYITEDKTGNLWFGTIGGGVSRYDGQSFSNFTTDHGLAHNNVLSITEDKTGNLWFGTREGVSRYDGKSFTTFTTAQGLAHNSVFIITEDKTGNLWFGTIGGGVSRYDGKSFTTFTTAQGLAGNNVLGATEDKTGNLWFSTGGGGVSRYDGQSFSTFTTAQGLAHNFVYSVKEDKKGNLWFGSQRGVSRYDGKSFTTFTTVHGLANNGVGSIIEDKTGNLWFGTRGGGVSRYDGKSFTTFTTTQGLAGNYVQSITEDKMGNLWIGTEYGGVSRYDGKSFTTFTTAQGLANNNVIYITGDKTGNLWFGTFGGGVSRYDGKSFSTFTTAQGLAHNQVQMISEDKSGNLWFGTSEGLSVLPAYEVRSLAENSDLNQVAGEDKGKKPYMISSTLFKSFKTADGIPDNVVNQVIQMPDGKIAVGTNLGITLFNPSSDFTKLTEIEIYNTSTGYPVKDVSAMLVDRKGMLWIGTGSEKTALVRFDYAALPRNMEPPTLVIQSVKVKDEPVCWYNLLSTREGKNHRDNATALVQEFFAYGKSMSASKKDSLEKSFASLQFDGITKFYPLPENLVLPYEFNQISFEFAAIETSKPFLVNYQYMLEGYDKYWSPVTKRSNASFGNMNEGSYSFKIKAQGANGVWTDPITYTFKVLPPWWRTWWAYALYILSFASGIYLVIRSRTKALKDEKELLEVKVSERTTELKNSLQNLKSAQSQLIQSEKMASLGELTAGIAHEIQNPLNFVNNFSEVSNELLDDMKDEFKKGETEVGFAIADDIKQNLEKILHHGKRADAIVKGMLQHSRRSSGVKESTDINALADEYLRLAYHGLRAKDKSFNATLNTDFDPTIGNINIVPQDIGRVILNLITNAFYVVNEKSKQGISGYEPTVEVSTKKAGDKVLISVKDNGNGIPQKILDKIFQPFFTTKPTGQGTGLGLSLSYDIVKAHGGELKVMSKEGEGSTFIIILSIQ
jgi:ligand-binding sensor domain-containing protein/signal transduction histidine kinase